MNCSVHSEEVAAHPRGPWLGPQGPVFAYIPECDQSSPAKPRSFLFLVYFDTSLRAFLFHSAQEAPTTEDRSGEI